VLLLHDSRAMALGGSLDRVFGLVRRSIIPAKIMRYNESMTDLSFPLVFSSDSGTAIIDDLHCCTAWILHLNRPLKYDCYSNAPVLPCGTPQVPIPRKLFSSKLNLKASSELSGWNLQHHSMAPTSNWRSELKAADRYDNIEKL